MAQLNFTEGGKSYSEPDFSAFAIDAKDGYLYGLTEDGERVSLGGFDKQGRFFSAGKEWTELRFVVGAPLISERTVEARIAFGEPLLSTTGFILSGYRTGRLLVHSLEDEMVAQAVRGRWAPVVTEGKTFSNELVFCDVDFSRWEPLQLGGTRGRPSALAERVV